MIDIITLHYLDPVKAQLVSTVGITINPEICRSPLVESIYNFDRKKKWA